jgi:tetratricopeptide (TPR) repeat protein
MTRRRTQKSARAAGKTTVLSSKTMRGTTAWKDYRMVYILAPVLLAAAVPSFIYFLPQFPNSSRAIVKPESVSSGADYRYVGADACRACHKDEVERWSGSYHALAMQDAEPSVRIAALGLVERFDPAGRADAASPLLSDPVLGVRIEAARILADVPDSQLAAGRLDARGKAAQEYRDYLALNADWPSENVNEGNFLLRQDRMVGAIAAYRRAINLDPLFFGAYVNLADLYRQQGRDDEGERQLRAGLALLPNAFDLHHALGLVLARQGKINAALEELGIVARIAPDNARYAYVYAVGLHSSGQPREALAVLKTAEARHPYDLDILSALISMLREADDDTSALSYARKAFEILPANDGIKQLLQELEREK